MNRNVLAILPALLAGPALAGNVDAVIVETAPVVAAPAPAPVYS